MILYVFFIIQSRSTAHSCPPSIFSPFLIISLKKERERGNPSVLLNTAAHTVATTSGADGLQTPAVPPTLSAGLVLLLLTFF